METALITVAGALVAAALIFGGRVGREWFLTRLGALTGYWFWITYESEDMRGDMHSVEIVYLRHRRTRRVDRLSGTAWRLFDRAEIAHRGRRWFFGGWYADPAGWGSYVWTREPAGSGGNTHVWQVGRGFAGEFLREDRISAAHEVVHDRVHLWTEWIRVPTSDDISPRLREKLDLISTDDADLYPWRIRRRLGIPIARARWIFSALASSAAIIDNRFALALEEWQKRQRERLDDGISLCRADLGPLLNGDDLEDPSDAADDLAVPSV
jgi:hypothetical protein